MLLSHRAASRPRVHKRYCVRFHGDPARRKRNPKTPSTQSATDSLPPIASRSPTTALTPIAASDSLRIVDGVADFQAAPTPSPEAVADLTAVSPALDEGFVPIEPCSQQWSSTQHQDFWPADIDTDLMSPQVSLPSPVNELNFLPEFIAPWDVVQGTGDGHDLQTLDSWGSGDYEFGPLIPEDASSFGGAKPQPSPAMSSDGVVKSSQLAPCRSLSPYLHGAEFERENGSCYLQFCRSPLPHALELGGVFQMANRSHSVVQSLRNASQGSRLCGLRLTTLSFRW